MGGFSKLPSSWLFHPRDRMPEYSYLASVLRLTASLVGCAVGHTWPGCGLASKEICPAPKKLRFEGRTSSEGGMSSPRTQTSCCAGPDHPFTMIRFPTLVTMRANSRPSFHRERIPLSPDLLTYKKPYKGKIVKGVALRSQQYLKINNSVIHQSS